MVKAFLKMPTEKLPAEHIPRFLAVDPAALPEKLRRPYQAKSIELYTLKQIAEGKKRGSVRMPEENCAIPQESRAKSVNILRMAGYEEISESEEEFVMGKTNCTERDLMCEFSLQIAVERTGKKGAARRRLFLHLRDPIFALVGQYRQQGRIRQTNFFGIGFPTCAPRRK